MSGRILLVSLTLLASHSVAAQQPKFVTPVLNAKSYAAWRDHILPTVDELRWETIPWLPSFGAGLRAANEQAKPLLLYAMNGHPLGCT